MSRELEGKILYSCLWSMGIHAPNAFATVPDIVLVNVEWELRMVLLNDDSKM